MVPTTHSEAREASSTKPLARYLTAAARIILGGMFLFAGLNYFFNFVPPPPEPMPEGALALAGAFMASGYLFPLVKGTQVLAALLLLSNRFVPLALVLLAPVLVNIVAFHAFLAPSGLAMVIVLAALELYLAWAYRKYYYTLLSPRAMPA